MRTILRNAKIWLGGDQFASAVLFDSSQILTVGTDADVEAQRQNDDQIIDGQGRLVLPGLCDTHLHCYNKGCTLQNIDLQDVSSIEEIVSRSRDYIQAHPDSSVVHGRGWNHDYFAEGRILNRADLDRISTRVPVVLTRACGHIACVNTCALQQLGFTGAIVQPEDGQIDVDE